MRERDLTVGWSELLAAAARGRISASDRQRLVDHVAECDSCRRALEGVHLSTPLGTAGIPPLSPERSAAIRARLVARAASDRRIEARVAAPWRRLPSGAGWLVAAGLASLLVSHHAFHRPLQLGWVVAGILAILCFGLGVQAFARMKEVRDLRSRLADLSTNRPGDPT
jgi:hypothetical protein